MKNFLDFKLFVTPQLVKVLYVLLQMVVLFYAWLFASFNSLTEFTATAVAYGLFVFLIGSICVRIVCELIMVLFRIHDNLDAIKAIKKDNEL